jgi:hypothetical protein
MFKKTVIAAAFALAAASPAFAAEAGAAGTWKGEVKLPTGQALPFVVHLKQSGDAITGTMDGIGGAPDVTIEDGKIAGDTITFHGTRQNNNGAVKFSYTGKLAGDAIDFDIVRQDGQGAPLKSHTVRQPG